ncbi:porin family protein [Dyella tabacisoli]|uniref:Porin family protein n=1 Tax=Dyella tabacisoli TaxID=2282381 RepID=A0A369UQL1_9GAMM|nr:porin family protein [Dyella tabacisoli]RDD82018.1 porin family protein [Dyella tabacisoli]
MKKTLFAIAFATAGLLAIPAAFAQDAGRTAQQGWYVGANAGYGEVSKGPYDDGDFAGGIKGGYRFAINPETSLAAEVGYQYLGRVDMSHANAFAGLYPSNGKSKLQGATAGLSLRYNFSQSWYGELRGGAFFAKGQGLTDEATPSFRRFNSTNYYAGAGVGYNINQQWSLGLNYDRYQGSGNGVHLDTNSYNVSAEYRF